MRYDNYEGWVQAPQLTAIDAGDLRQPASYTAGFATPVTTNDTMFYVPYASPMCVQNNFSLSIMGTSFTYLMQPQQIWKVGELRFSETTLAAIYQPYLNAPYLWGGKSVWGTDCSGFVQQVFKLFGVKLLRDAYLQAEQGEVVSSLSKARLGDLAFFQNDKSRINHVGIVLNKGRIIHASGQVRIDKLNEEGILNEKMKEQTHKTHSIRRFF